MVLAPRTPPYSYRAVRQTRDGIARCLIISPRGRRSIAAQGLSSPLALGLVRDVYEEEHSCSHLLKARDAEDFVKRMNAQVLSALYAESSGGTLRYDKDTASRVLAAIAREMNRRGDRDLAWWEVPRLAEESDRQPLRSRPGLEVVASLWVGLIWRLLRDVSTTGVRSELERSFERAQWV